MKLLRQLETIFRYQMGILTAGIPSQVYLVINEKCNLTCQFCNFWKGIYQKEGRDVLSTSEIKSLILKMADLQIPYLTITGGEPFLREDMISVLRYAVRHIPHVRVQTNGTLITDSIAERIVKHGLLDEIWISLDGIDSTHDKLRGKDGTFEEVIKGLDRITYFKKKHKSPFPYIIIHTVVNKFNLNELSQLLNICIKYKVGEWFVSYVTDITEERLRATGQTLDYADFSSLQMTSAGRLLAYDHKLSFELLRQMSSARKKGLTIFVDYLLKRGTSFYPRRKCILLWASIMVSPYAEVLTCPMLDKYVMGDLRKEDLMKVWNNDKFKKVRSLVAERSLPICEDCCCQRRSILDHLKDPANFKRIFVPRKLREIIYKHHIPVP